MKIVGGLLLSVFCVGSVFSSEMDHEAFVLERTSDDILRNMPQTDLISRIRVLEDAYFELKDQNAELAFERDEFEKVAEELGVALEERTAQLEDTSAQLSAQLEERTEQMARIVNKIGQN